MGKTKTLVFGDSSSRIFSTLLDPKKVKVHTYSGATIRGLCKTGTTLNVADKIADQIFKYQPDEIDAIILFFGTVDAHLTYYYRKMFKGEKQSYRDYVKDVMECYRKFINSFAERVRSKFIIIGPYPPITTNKDFPDFLKRYICKEVDEHLPKSRENIPMILECFDDVDRYLRKNQMDTLPERIANVRYFNDQLSNLGPRYVSINKDIVDDTGLIEMKYRLTQAFATLHQITYEEVIDFYFPYLKGTQIQKANLIPGYQERYQKFLAEKKERIKQFEQEGDVQMNILKRLKKKGKSPKADQKAQAQAKTKKPKIKKK